MTDSSQKPFSVCVFCASSDVIPTVYRDAARMLGRNMAVREMSLVYGGGNNGLMGVLAREMHECGGKITGVIPLALKDRGYAYEKADAIIVTDGLRERKAVMEERADGFLGLPGGFGTLEEMIEIITLKQLNMHVKPIVFLNINSFFDGLLNQFEICYRERFISEEYRSLHLVTDSIDEALDYLKK
ncbi:MAG: TIGR00730 family Rossman fold protein [Candidatus Latescibacter sp.]|nr:TIGR00730 family Rossman fold protein [Candidatus Latescibacter sp.]